MDTNVDPILTPDQQDASAAVDPFEVILDGDEPEEGYGDPDNLDPENE
jgi:hypothetical protein